MEGLDDNRTEWGHGARGGFSNRRQRSWLREQILSGCSGNAQHFRYWPI